MKQSKLCFLIYFITIFAHGAELQHFPKVTIADSQTRFVQSNNVQTNNVQQEYKLLINLPANYAKSKKHYPVIYLLDAQWDFPLLASMYGQSYYDGFIPEAIIVGVTWGGNHPQHEQLRVRDFTPTVVGEPGKSGGAGKFLKFVKTELIPLIATEYRSNQQRVLIGSSLGGLFALFSLFTEPQLFDAYIATAPALSWDEHVIYSYAKNLEQSLQSKPIRIYSAAGEYDTLMPELDKMLGFFKVKNYPTIDLKTEKLAGLGHAGVKSPGNIWGLQYAFQKPQLNLNPQQLAKWQGTYRSDGSGRRLVVDSSFGQLRVTGSDNKAEMFFASSENTFYKNGVLFNLSFNQQAKSITLVVERFATVDTFVITE